MLALLLAAIILMGTAAAAAGPRLLIPFAHRSSLSKTLSDRDCPELDDAPAPQRLERGSHVLVTVGHATFPTTAVFAPDQSGNGLLGERGGIVRRITKGLVTREVVLDLSDDTQEEGGDGGLLGLAYSPDGEWIYVERTTKALDDVVTAYRLDATGRPDRGAERVILRSDHPSSIQHHGGAFGFGVDGMLYVGFGDGGGLGDPREYADNRSLLLGKILRIDPTPFATDPYRIPADNPFVDEEGVAPEIWVYGVRNPFRLGVDSVTGDLWLGDVGQSCWEELNRLTPGVGGSNLGWDRKEGTHDYEGGVVPGRELEPVFEINHRLGWCSIVAGYVPRDGAAPLLDGRLLFTDYCKGQIWLLDADAAAADIPLVRDTGLRADRPLAIVPGPSGLPWVLTLDGAILEIRPRG